MNVFLKPQVKRESKTAHVNINVVNMFYGKWRRYGFQENDLYICILLTNLIRKIYFLFIMKDITHMSISIIHSWNVRPRLQSANILSKLFQVFAASQFLKKNFILANSSKFRFYFRCTECNIIITFIWLHYRITCCRAKLKVCHFKTLQRKEEDIH